MQKEKITIMNVNYGKKSIREILEDELRNHFKDRYGVECTIKYGDSKKVARVS